MLVAVLAHAVRRADDVAEEHVAEAARDAARIERRERRHDVLGRAERIVLVAVLDVGDAVAPEEPRVELDAGREGARRRARRRAMRCACSSRIRRKSSFTTSQWSSMSWLPWMSVSAWPSATNAASSAKTSACRCGDTSQLLARVVGGVAETVRTLLFRELRRASRCARRSVIVMPMKSMKSPAMTMRQRSAFGGVLR